MPMWPRVDGFYVYLPDDGTGSPDEPSIRYGLVQQKLASIGIESSWVYKYNAGANPIGFNLPKSKMNDPLLLEVLKEGYALA